MVKIHVWLRDAQHVGHTAITVGNVYVSFWPAESASKVDLKIKRSHPGTFVQAMREDIRSEGGRQPTTIEVPDLNEERVLDYVNSLVQNVPRYQLARHNCSHVVAKCLIVGAGVEPSFTPHAGQYSLIGRFLGIGIWTPDQVLLFARELASR